MTEPNPTEPPTSSEGSDFWRFSLALYAQPAVPPACLRLQDGHGLDVNLLLFCLYAGSRGRRLDAGELAALDARVAAWRAQVVQPLRAMRRWLKTADLDPALAPAELRPRVQALELAAEHRQQLALAAAVAVDPGGAADPAASLANLQAYAAVAGAALDAAAHQALGVLWEAAHPSAPG